ncbi:MAG: branched-chain amino acid aminotransferase [Rhodospirillales bacterium]|jgi:branched-chain amino acid aminotransferase|nr:branched-chain amino acid aminotransferase [Rhodospirillales bacterium]MBT4038425.1 branched-chain amino acid aminotransferase [Rhodospirillales bacterium]MBT4625706.1 branched-chain amino acid aminotransferase [Rhodospirillales bacterium]MBT5352372.1 branched-chain amino acid aminotransferase [Rhodospirillales bacterium]MBT5519818.1 branched-chain amino acid aminotransferase [Rhodospirillales bacterium]
MPAPSFAEHDGLIWYNGEMVPWREANVHVLTHGLHYASSVFEGDRAYGGKIFKLTEHSQRLKKSAELLGFDIPYSVEEIDEACREACRANNIVDGYVRPVAWRGSEMMGISAQNNKINLVVAAWQWPSYFSPELREKGIALKTSPWRRPSPESAPVHAKAAGLYMICTLSKHEAEREGFQDALMLDYRGYVSEATGANIFMTFGDDNTLHTPIPDCFLNGLTRQTIIQLAKERGIEVIERVIMPEELADAKEVFLTGTAAEVTPVGRIDDNTYVVGDMVKNMMEAYETLVGKTPASEAAAE